VSDSLQAGSLTWPKVAALGVAIAISGDFAGWNYGLGIGGWGGMMVAALAMALLFWCLTQCLAELAAAMPEGGGFDFYTRRALGPGAGYLAGMSVGVALAVGAGLAMSFGEAYTTSMLGIGGWPVKLLLLAVVLVLQLRGAREAAGLTMLVGVVTVLVLALFCVQGARHFDAANLGAGAAAAGHGLMPHGLAGAAGCIPFALFLFLGVEQAAHAATEMRDMATSIPKALAVAIGVAFVTGISVLVLATGAAGVEYLAPQNDPLYAAVMAHPQAWGALPIARVVGAGALLAIMGTFFSLAYAGSRQFFHLAGAGYLPRWMQRTNRRHAPHVALLLLAVIALVTAAFPPDAAMVVFIFLISVSHVLVLIAFIGLRRRQAELPRPYRAAGGQLVAGLATLLSLAVMVSCYQLQAVALRYAVGGLIALSLGFAVFKPGDAHG
jgi:ethanolamine permease